MQNHSPARKRTATARPTTSLGLALLLALPLAGCGGGGSNTGGSGSPSPAPVAPASVSAVTQNGLTATLTENTSAIPVGGNVTYTLTLTNNTSQQIRYQTFGVEGFPSFAVGGTLQIAAPSNNSSYPIATSSGGKFTGDFGLGPGQSVAYVTAVSKIFSAPGNYVATASFTTHNGSPDQTTTLVPLTVSVSGSSLASAPLSISTPTANGLTATFAENTSVVGVSGGGVTYTLTLTNSTPQPIVISTYLSSTGGPPVVPGDVRVLNSAGQQVYPNPITSAGVVSGPTYQQSNITISPGQAISTLIAVPGQYFSQPGAYSANDSISTGPYGFATLGPLTVTAQ